MAVINQYLADILIVLGAVIGSVKGELLHTDTNKTSKVVDIVLGVFCGCVIAYHYQDSFTRWVCGLIAVVSAMIAANILEVVFDLTPNLVRKLIKSYGEKL